MSLRQTNDPRRNGQRPGLRLLMPALMALSLSVGTSPLAAQTPAQQSPMPPAPKTLPLDTGACTVVAPGGIVSLDWNPGFDYESGVSGVDRFGLTLTQVAQDGATPLRRGAPGTAFLRSTSVTPLANGYYHIEFRVPVLNGTFRVIDAGVAPHLIAGYDGPKPQMTNKPSRSPYCLTVVDPRRARQQNSQ